MTNEEIKDLYVESITELVCDTSIQYLSYRETKKIRKSAKFIIDSLVDDLNFGW